MVRDHDYLHPRCYWATLRNSPIAVLGQLGADSSAAVEVKREIALLLIKRREHDQALEYLRDVQFLEQGLYGSGSLQLGRTLKALGTVYMLKGAKFYGEAGDCLLEASRVFEALRGCDTHLRDIQQKLQAIQVHKQGR